MTLEQTIQQAIMESIKAKDTVAMNATRAIKGEILLFRTSGKGKEVSDQDILSLIQKLIKQRKEASEVYLSAGRKDLSDNELSEASVMERFLPRQLSEEEIKDRVREIILQSGASSMKEMGKVMGIATKALAGVADGRAISAAVKQQLS